ncbi:MAG TPA: FAD-binding oxidoreductase [Acidobacteriota bacterium]|jgi:alkyldihydroxyacetonephosphate synthase|nr:FAD-binding oxidoreductase [Acidobacteriota bacterium]
MTNARLFASLARIVGATNVLDRVEARARYANDQYWYAIAAAAAGQPVSRPHVAVRPDTAEQVAAVVRLANRLRVPLTPWGGGSGVQGAANADRGGIVLDLRSLNRVRTLDQKSQTCVVEAGKVCREFEAELNTRGLSFTHYPASAEWATIGGCISARGSGVLSTKYGKIEEHVLSLEFVTPTGELVHTPPVPRHAAGPELTQLLVGAEGTLGIVTAANVKLHALPKKRVFAAFSFSNLPDGIEAGRRIMTSGLRPPVMRLYDQHAAAHSLARAVEMPLEEATLVLMFDGEHPELVELEATRGSKICRGMKGRKLPASIGETWWERRYVFYYPPYAPELPSIWGTVDVVADFAHIGDVYHATTRAIHAAAAPKWNLQLNTHFSHWYEWGSMIYARMKIPTGPKDLRAAKALHDKIIRAGVEAAMAAGAVMNDHHGVGLRLAPFMRAQYGPALTTLSRIKHALDPRGILCPGKLGL